MMNFREKEGLAADAGSALTSGEAILEALKPFARLGRIILAEAPPEAETVVVFNSASGERFSLRLDQFRAAMAAVGDAE